MKLKKHHYFITTLLISSTLIKEPSNHSQGKLVYFLNLLKVSNLIP